MDKSSPEILPFKGGSEEAKVKLFINCIHDIILFIYSYTDLYWPTSNYFQDRLRGAIIDIDSLLENYDKISGGGGGDNVRLYLGKDILSGRVWK